MKKILINIKYLTLALVLITGAFAGIKQASAFAGGVVTYSDTIIIPYTVTASNIPPYAYAGAGKTITLPPTPPSTWAPGEAIWAPGEAIESDSDGTVVSRYWTPVSKPSGAPDATITNGNTLTPTFSGMNTEGVYAFSLTVTDNLGATDSNVTFVTVTTGVPVGGGKPPTANAGGPKSITLPTSGVSVLGSGTDPDGNIVAYSWTQLPGGPTTASIVSPSTPGTPINSMTIAGNYNFRFTVTDNDGNTGHDDMMVTVKPAGSGATGTLTISPNTCSIPLNQGSCLTGDVNATWNTTGTTSPNLWNGSSTLSTLANNATPFPIGSSVGYPSRTFYLRDGTTNLDSPKTVTANCGAGGTWDSGVGKCVSSSVAGACGPTHDTNPCAVGTVVNPPGIQTGSTSWTWTCIEDIVSPQCSQTFPVTQCNDNADNDSDGLKDKFDPGCHTDGIVISGNEDQTYDPLDTNEKNNPKVKVKEL